MKNLICVFIHTYIRTHPHWPSPALPSLPDAWIRHTRTNGVHNPCLSIHLKLSNTLLLRWFRYLSNSYAISYSITERENQGNFNKRGVFSLTIHSIVLLSNIGHFLVPESGRLNQASFTHELQNIYEIYFCSHTGNGRDRGWCMQKETELWESYFILLIFQHLNVIWKC